jgi:hypothetical protein
MAELVSVTLEKRGEVILPRMRLKSIEWKNPEAIVIRTYKRTV